MDLLHSKTNIPVPKMYCFCDDKRIIGAAFYVMQFLDGRVIYQSSPHLPNGFTKKDRTETFYNLAKLLAQIHTTDYKTIGLETLLSSNAEKWTPDHFCKRYQKPAEDAVNRERNKHFSKKIDLLNNAIFNYKNNDYVDYKNECFIHGDVHLENIIWHKTENKIIGLVDYECCNIGNPVNSSILFNICNKQ